jgi:hypothetical protein
MKVLLDTYCFSQFAGTTAVSDMIPYEIYQTLENEKIFIDQYSAGGICDDCNDIVRLLDLHSTDIEHLWKNTKADDPIRELLVDLFTHELDVDVMDSALREAIDDSLAHEIDACETMDQLRANSIECTQWAVALWGDFARDRRQKAMESFAGTLYPKLVCAQYHNHDHDELRYRSTSSSTVSKQMSDDSIDEPAKQLVEFRNYTQCEIVNMTADHVDLEELQIYLPHWDWKRVRAVNTFVFIPPKGPQIRKPRPVYFEHDEVDQNGWYPSHPGHGMPNWKPEGVKKYNPDNWKKS